MCFGSKSAKIKVCDRISKNLRMTLFTISFLCDLHSVLLFPVLAAVITVSWPHPSRPLFLAVRTELPANVGAHPRRCLHITPSHIETRCKPRLSSGDNKSEV